MFQCGVDLSNTTACDTSLDGVSASKKRGHTARPSAVGGEFWIIVGEVNGDLNEDVPIRFDRIGTVNASVNRIRDLLAFSPITAGLFIWRNKAI